MRLGRLVSRESLRSKGSRRGFREEAVSEEAMTTAAGLKRKQWYTASSSAGRMVGQESKSG